MIEKMIAMVDTRLPIVPTPERVNVTTPLRVKSHGGHCGWQHRWSFWRHSSDTLAAVRFAWRTWHGRSVIGVDVVDVVVDVIVVDVVGVSEVVVGVVDSNVVDESVDVVVMMESVVEVVGSIEVAVVDVVVVVEVVVVETGVVVVVVVVTGVVVVIITGSCLKRSIKNFKDISIPLTLIGREP